MIVRLDILITLTLKKLACLLSGAEFCSRDQIHFQTPLRYMVCKNSLFGRTLKHANAPIIITIIIIAIVSIIIIVIIALRYCYNYHFDMIVIIIITG